MEMLCNPAAGPRPCQACLPCMPCNLLPRRRPDQHQTIFAIEEGVFGGSLEKAALLEAGS